MPFNKMCAARCPNSPFYLIKKIKKIKIIITIIIIPVHVYGHLIVVEEQDIEK